MEYHSWKVFKLLSFLFFTDGVISNFTTNSTLHQDAERIRRATCGMFDWPCKNGQCIGMDELCDGISDCKDASDETTESCIHIRCPNYSFRCAYGACVNGDAECNSIQECVDGSDETSHFCQTQNAHRQGTNSICSSEEFSCNSGKCIALDQVCDGKAHCNDASDETVEQCSSTFCPSFAYRCGYGACISGDAKCDKIIDCNDGSDETERLCGSGHVADKLGGVTTVQVTHRPPVAVTKPTLRPPPSPTKVPSDGRCSLPDLPNAIVYYEYDQNDVIQTKDLVDNFSAIKYKCKAKFALLGEGRNICLNGTFAYKHPKCLRYCNSVAIAGVSFQAVCERNNVGIPCDQTLLEGTIARLSCQVGYVKPASATPLPDAIICGSDGEWDFSPYRCAPVCGTVGVQGTPFIFGGETANSTTVPWNAGIYKRRNEEYSHICGGTIITAKVIVSAAHCFWANELEGPYDKSNFAVAVGKSRRSFYAAEVLNVQRFNVSELYIARGYRDAHLWYQNDLAILVLTDFIRFLPHIKPICMEFNLPYRDKFLPPSTVGRVSGWGRIDADGNLDEQLRIGDLNVIPDDVCKAKTGTKYLDLITGDKFCVGGSDRGVSVCQGDSGAGFVVPRDVHGVETFFLWGLVSNGLNDRGICGPDYLTVFTNVQLHSDEIFEYEIKYRPK